MVDSDDSYDLVIIGGGPIGLSTAWHASKRGMRTLIIEKYGFLNEHGSSAGMSRQFRVQYAQDYMAELALSSQSYWAELQNLTRDVLITQCGSVWFGDPDMSSQEGGIAAAMQTMDQLGIPYEPLTATDIEKRFAFSNIPSDYTGFFQANGGIIDLKGTEFALYRAIQDSGLVDLKAYEPVTAIQSPEDGPITVQTTKATYQCGKLAITSGAYSNDITQLLGFTTGLTIWEMSSAYFRKNNQNAAFPTWFVFQQPSHTSLFYGFPEVSWSNPDYIRVAPDIPDRIITDPRQRTGIPSETSLTYTSNWVSEHMPSLDSKPEFAATCLIALSSDSSKELLLDYAPPSCPGNENIVIYTAGWAAKFIPILGDTICQMLDAPIQSVTYGKYKIALSNFAIDWQSN